MSTYETSEAVLKINKTSNENGLFEVKMLVLGRYSAIITSQPLIVRTVDYQRITF